MNYIISIQIDDQITLQGLKEKNSKKEVVMNEQLLDHLVGKYSFYNSDDEYCFSFSLNVHLNIDERKNDFKSLTQENVEISFLKMNSNYNEKDIRDQILYWFFDQINQSSEQNYNGLEIEIENSNSDVEDPYDPELIRVDPKQMSISYIYDLISEYESLELSADFQRNFIWTDAKRKSRLIESILLRIPLPAFYFSTNERGSYQIVDGIQRINVINKFINGEFKLTDLEYLEDCKDCFFSEKHDKSKSKSKRKYLDKKYVRRVLETQLTINVIDPQTPTQVKYDIFKRLNTGGKPLNNMEIRNSFASQRIREFLRELTNLKDYSNSSLATVNGTRFADLELILRFISFYENKMEKNPRFFYRGKMENYLDDVIEYLIECSDIKLIQIKFEYQRMLKLNNKLFGKYAFRKVFKGVTTGSYRMPLVSKSLFTAMSVNTMIYYDNLSKLGSNYINENVENLALFIANENKFYESLSYGTNDRERIDIVFSSTEKFILNLLEGYDDNKN